MSSDEEIFNQINKDYFNSDLEKIGEKNISSGTYNFVIIKKSKILVIKIIDYINTIII